MDAKVVKRILSDVLSEFYVVNEIIIKEDKNAETAYIDLDKNIIGYNPNWNIFKKFLKDILRHEIGHLAFVPTSNRISTFVDMQLFKLAKNYPELKDPKFRHNILNVFYDIKVNLRIVAKFKDTKIDESYKEEVNGKEDDFWKLVLSIQTEVGRNFREGINFGYDKRSVGRRLRKPLEELLKLNWMDEEIVGGMKMIDYYPSGEKLAKGVVNFYEILKKYNIDLSKIKSRRFDVKISLEGIMESVSDMIAEGNISPKEGKEYLDNLLKGYGKGGGGGGGFPSETELYVYLGMVKKYDIRVIPPRLYVSGDEVLGFEKWSLRDEVHSLYPYSPSGPWILPGISVKYVRKGSEGRYVQVSLPDLLIVLDDSGSMPSPRSLNSLPCVVAGVLAKHYLINGSLVGVVKFSGTTRFRGWFDDLLKALYYILEYEGDGTRLDFRKVAKIITSSKKTLDVVLITDAIFSDEELNGFLETLEGSSNVVRGFVFVYGNSNKVIEGGEKTKVIYINNWEDIIDAVIGTGS